MKTKDLSKHISATYKTLRLGIAVIALAFPPLLGIGGYILAKLPLDGSMSAYYHAGDSLNPGHGVMRNVFVGILFAIGTILFLYQGITRLEDYALNIAGVLALGIALFPMTWPVGSKGTPFSLHGICAVSFFVCIAYVCIFRASDTLTLIHDHATRERYRRSYKLLGVAMVTSPAIAFILTSVLQLNTSLTFFVEAVGVYVFAAYWLLKSREIAGTNADQRAVTGKLRVEPHRLSDAFRPVSITPVEAENVQGVSG